jgi:pyruvate/2-oxoglutarate dehydrogenase complex dihydrolipoamide acyltransferase (E2) component
MNRPPSAARIVPWFVSIGFALCACSGAASPPSEGGAPPPTAPASAAASASASVVTGATATASAPEPAAATATATASASAAAPAPSAAPAEPPPETPLPKVQVKNIGMHIGGGPNDNVTKEPIRRSVEPHFDEFRRCWVKVDDQKKGGDFGVDLLIDGKGGAAKVTHPRTAITGDGFKECVLQVFEGIDFLKPRGGKKTMVSYSLRFTP